MDLLASSICLGDRSTGWLIDVVDRVWFTKDVTMTTPEGDGKWYQVRLVCVRIFFSDELHQQKTFKGKKIFINGHHCTHCP